MESWPPRQTYNQALEDIKKDFSEAGYPLEGSDGQAHPLHALYCRVVAKVHSVMTAQSGAADILLQRLIMSKLESAYDHYRFGRQNNRVYKTLLPDFLEVLTLKYVSRQGAIGWNAFNLLTDLDARYLLHPINALPPDLRASVRKAAETAATVKEEEEYADDGIESTTRKPDESRASPTIQPLASDEQEGIENNNESTTDEQAQS